MTAAETHQPAVPEAATPDAAPAGVAAAPPDAGALARAGSCDPAAEPLTRGPPASTVAGEHREIATELQENLGQQLAGLAYLAQALASRATTVSPPVATAAEELAATARRALSDCRRLATRSADLALRAQGGEVAVRDLVERVTATAGVSATVEWDERLQADLDARALHELHGVVQDAVAGVVHRGRTTWVAVRATRLAGELELVVEADGADGASTDAGALALRRRLGGRRAERLGGRVDVAASARDASVRVRFTAPWPPGAAE